LTVFWWRKNKKRVILANHHPDKGPFSQNLSRIKTRFFCPQTKNTKGQKFLPSIIQCLNYMKDGKISYTSVKENQIKDIKKKTPITNEILNQLCEIYQVNIRVFYEKVIDGGRQIAHDKTFGDGKYEETIGLLRSFKDRNYYAALMPDLDGSIEFITKYFYCSTHADWVPINDKEAYESHLKQCKRCQHCGQTIAKYIAHECDGMHYERDKKRKFKNRARRYEKSETKDDPMKNYFCDLETIGLGYRKSYVTYAGAIIDDNKDEDNVELYMGKNSLDQLMNYIIENCDGIVWFFNGSRFDNLFLCSWLIKAGVTPIPGSIIKIGNAILSMSFPTKNGKATLKDLARFLPGSLAENCKAFGLPAELSKGDIDHEKIKTWDDVDKQQEEIRKYLGNDVISLKHIYRLFAEEMYTNYQLHVSQFFTSSHLAYGAWTTTIQRYRKDHVLYKTPVKDEEKMRKAYKGGRVICGRPHWKSSWWGPIKRSLFDVPLQQEKEGGYNDDINGKCTTKELYDRIDDFLVFVDANSLYPSVQVDRKYPTGKHHFTTFVKDSPEEKYWKDQIQFRNRACKDEINRSIYCVDVTPPNNLTIAFLMTKDEKTGGVEQNLLRKEKQWFTGPELWEASKLKYIITTIHEKCTWERSADIFSEFVKKTYELKKNSKKDTPKYVCAKNMLNGLTGKFAQHLLQMIHHIYLKDQPICHDVREMTEIFDELENILGWFAVSDVETEYCGFPIHLSAFILAYSRIYMSKLLRKMDITTDCKLCPLYGDTDSLILPNEAWMRLPEKYKGEVNLGQMKYEIHGKIIEIIVVAPKTYCITYIEDKTYAIKSITKSKGIPHSTKPYRTMDLFLHDQNELERGEREFNRMEAKKNDKNQLPSDEVKLTTKNYLFKDLDNNILFSSRRIPRKCVKEVLYRRMNMDCVYGSMERKVKAGNIENISVTLMSARRRFGKTDWWSTGVRVVPEKDKSEYLYASAVPVGHHRLTSKYNQVE